MQESGLRLAGFERHAEGLFGYISGQARAHRPADDGTRVQVQQHGQIQPPLHGPDVSNIACPDPVGLRHRKLALKHVRHYG